MKTRLVILTFCFILFNSCNDHQIDNHKIGNCPSINDPISWKIGQVYFGTWQFGYSWIDGNFAIGTGGVSVTNLHDDCNCPYIGTETGGFGNTYAVGLYAADTVAVIFRWKCNTFCELEEIFDKWQGKTEKSVQMNSLLSDFLQKYTGDFSVSRTDSTQYDAYYDSGIHVTAWFTAKKSSLGRLKKLKIIKD